MRRGAGPQDLVVSTLEEFIGRVLGALDAVDALEQQLRCLVVRVLLQRLLQAGLRCRHLRRPDASVPRCCDLAPAACNLGGDMTRAGGGNLRLL